MIRRTVLLVVLVSAFALVLQGADIPANFAATHYYILSLGEMAVDLPSLIQSIQSSGQTVVQYEGDEATITRGNDTVDDLLSNALADDTVLLVDGDRLYLSEVGASYTYVVRPAESGYELVINPEQELSVNDTLAAILVDLQQLGILGSEVNLDFASFAKADLKGPAAPEGVLIDSTLYGLTVASDWFAYSSLKGLTQVGLRVEVVAEKLPGGVLDTAFSDAVIEESDSLVKLLLPIDELLTLAESSAIGYVRIAYQPSVP